MFKLFFYSPYAAFYAMEAIFLTKNLVFSKQGAVIGTFNKHFIKQGIFPKEFSKLITRIFRERHIGDYEFDLSIGENEAKEYLEHTEKIVTNITSYLAKEGFIMHK